MAIKNNPSVVTFASIYSPFLLLTYDRYSTEPPGILGVPTQTGSHEAKKTKARCLIHLSRTQYQMLVLLLPLPDRFVQRYHKRHVALVRLFEKKKFGDVIVLDLIVVPRNKRAYGAKLLHERGRNQILFV